MTLLRWLTDCDSHSPTLLDLFISSNAAICSTVAFLSIVEFWSCGCLSFHGFSVKHKFGYPVYDCLWLLVLTGRVFMIVWDVPLEDIFKLSASVFTSEFCEWVHVGIFFNWDSLHTRLNSLYKAWSSRKRSTKRLKYTGTLFRRNLLLKDVSSF